MTPADKDYLQGWIKQHENYRAEQIHSEVSCLSFPFVKRRLYFSKLEVRSVGCLSVPQGYLGHLGGEGELSKEE